MLKRRNIKIAPLFFLAFSFASCSVAQSGIISLIGNGNTKYSIYITGGNEQENKAAGILEDYLHKISGVNFEINSKKEGRQIFVLTESNAKKLFPGLPVGDLENDGVLIQTSGQNILIAGGDSTGVVNAVYEFLEKFLGCRYYAEDAIYIPRNSKLNISGTLNYKYVPVIKYRYINYSQAFKGSYAAWNKLTNQSGNPNTLKRPGWGLWVHSMFTLVPPEKYFKDHPEYYALRNGKRVKTQLCLTNPDVLKIASESLAEIIKQNPGAQFFSVSQMDNNGYCECDNCKRIAQRENSQSGPILEFVNKIAVNFPDKTISTLAYNYSRKAPGSMNPEKNVNIFFCATDANRAIPFNKDTKAGSVYYDLMQWKAKTSNIFFWDYLIDFQHLYMPFPNYYMLKPNIQLLASNNISYTFQQGWAFSEGEMNELRCYLVAKLLWDPNINVNATIKEFSDFYYGAAGKYINAYLQSINSALQQNKNIVLTNNDAPFDHNKDYLSPDQIKQYKQFFASAINAVKNSDPVYVNRVQNAMQALRYVILEVQAKEDNTDVSYTNVLDTFRQVAQQQKSVLVNEGTMKFDDYYTQESNYLKTKSIKSAAFNATATVITPAGYVTETPLSVLFDNLLGSIITDKKWVAFEKPYVELVIDLKNTTSFSSISMNFLHDPNFLTMLPEKISFSVSDNKIDFKEVGEAKNMFFGANALGVKKEIKNFQFSAPKNISAKYIKIGIKMIAASNYAGSDKTPAMRCDEIIVK